MKILFVVTKAVLGGHVISALTIARRLKERGHETAFAGGHGELTPVISAEMPYQELSIPMFHDAAERFFTYFTWRSFRSVLDIARLARKSNVEMIHAFDSRSYFCARIAALLTGVPVSCTLCGGIDPHYNLPLLPRIMVFSEEQKDKLVRQYHWNPFRVEVVRTRIDAERILAAVPPPLEEFESRYHVAPGRLRLMMISSFDATKINSVRNVLKAVEILLEQGHLLQMVFIGGKGDLYDRFRADVCALNARRNETAVVCTGPLMQAHSVLPHADIVFGVGRSAFEGMLHSKPVVIVGEMGFAGVVSESSLPDIAYYNFSGRNQRTVSPPEQLAAVLKQLVQDPELRSKLGQFGRHFVLDEIDVAKGLDAIERAYLTNSARQSLGSKMWQWLSVACALLPIWRDNAYRPMADPLKRFVRQRS